MKVNIIITLKKPDIDEQIADFLLLQNRHTVLPVHSRFFAPAPKVGALGEIGIPYFLYIAGFCT